MSQGTMEEATFQSVLTHDYIASEFRRIITGRMESKVSPGMYAFHFINKSTGKVDCEIVFDWTAGSKKPFTDTAIDTAALVKYIDTIMPADYQLGELLLGLLLELLGEIHYVREGSMLLFEDAWVLIHRPALDA